MNRTQSTGAESMGIIAGLESGFAGIESGLFIIGLEVGNMSLFSGSVGATARNFFL